MSLQKVLSSVVILASCRTDLPPQTMWVTQDGYCGWNESDAFLANKYTATRNSRSAQKLVEKGEMFALKRGEPVMRNGKAGGSLFRIKMKGGRYCFVVDKLLSPKPLSE